MALLTLINFHRLVLMATVNYAAARSKVPYLPTIRVSKNDNNTIAICPKVIGMPKCISRV